MKESYIEFRKRVIDPISKSFCAAKWLNSTIWLNTGATASCHLPPAHKVSLSEIAQDPSALHNSIHKKIARSQMLKGERPKECEYCWKIEDLSDSHMSDRIFKTHQFSESDIGQIAKSSAQKSFNPRTLEIAFDRNCQFACTYCNASFSTRWGVDIEKNGVYKNLQTDGAGAYKHDGKWADLYKNKNNPYLEAFWKWWPELSGDLEQIRITGGEPTLSPDFWRLLEMLKGDSGIKAKGKLMVAINSNLGCSPTHLEKLIEFSKSGVMAQLYTSCESTGRQAEYIRDGLNYENFIKNLKIVLDTGKFFSVNIMITASIHSLSSLDLFLLEMIELKKKYSKHRLVWMINILRFPSFLSPLVLGKKTREIASKKLKTVLEVCQNSTSVQDFEAESLRRFIHYIDEVDVPHSGASEAAKLQSDFKIFTMQYDQRRGKSFQQTFPEWKDWFENIDVEKFRGSNEPVNGDSTIGWHNVKELVQLGRKEGFVYPEENEYTR